MLLVKTYVAPSAVHGLGLFAAEPIARGACIWRFDPRIDRLYGASEREGAPAAHSRGSAQPADEA